MDVYLITGMSLGNYKIHESLGKRERSDRTEGSVNQKTFSGEFRAELVQWGEL